MPVAHLARRSHVNLGFSLIELAIGLAIIGLLIGGVVTGASLIGQAGRTEVIRQLDELQTAYKMFSDRYQELPGDMSAASVFWGLDCGNNGTVGPNNTMGCNGNGNNSWRNNEEETMLALRHLSLAKIYEGDWPGRYQGTEVKRPVPGTHFPEGAIDNSFFAFRNPTYGQFRRFGQAIQFGAPVSNITPDRNNWYFPQMPVLKPEDAKYIDGKVDDGIAFSGKIYGINQACTDAPYNFTGDDYKVAKQEAVCGLLLWLD